MHHRAAKIGLAGVTATIAIAVSASPALADYAPNSHDVVGVGSDTLQYAGDFVADGSYVGTAGYNSALNKYKMINFDATPDANARLAYGAGGSASNCGPGTGTTQGTGNSSAGAGTPCTLNPTIVLRAGTKPIQRPNGSGDGAKAFGGDTLTGHDWITYSRASSSQDSQLPSSTYDVAKIGTDPLQILAASTTNAIPLTKNQLLQIYSGNITNWTQLDNSSDSTATVHYYTAADVSGGFTPGPNDVQLTSGTIIPIIPQVGSGTRSSFESDIGISDSTVVTETNAGVVKVGEENDPTAIANIGGTNAANAIEPMSGGRLNLFLGINGTGGGTSAPAGSNGKGGYFTDPSCKLSNNNTGFSGTGDCSSSTNGSATGPILSVPVAFTSGTPSTTQAGTDTSLYTDTRSLYIYFRKADVDSTTAWQTGSLLNAVRTLFYNPCDASTSNNGNPGTDGASGPNGNGFTTADCVTIGSTTYGPGGVPYFQKAAGQADIATAGINATYGVSTTGTGGTFS